MQVQFNQNSYKEMNESTKEWINESTENTNRELSVTGKSYTFPEMTTHTNTIAAVKLITFALLQCLSIADRLGKQFSIVMTIGLTEADCVKVYWPIGFIAVAACNTQHSIRVTAMNLHRLQLTLSHWILQNLLINNCKQKRSNMYVDLLWRGHKWMPSANYQTDRHN